MTRDSLNPGSRHRGSHKKARQSRSLPVMENQARETPYQDYYRIKKMIQAKVDLKGGITDSDLFVDASFPPDRSSLTYVYSGDDKYERTVFRRPKEITDGVTLTGVGGICEEPFPWQQWKQRSWFHAALVLVSLNVQALERMIPGFRKHEQNFEAAYNGCFHFHIWRFGEWVDIIVDDYLPVLDDVPLFSKPMGGAACEMWGPLVEKAYAKCKRTFQGIEYGFTLDALTDLTGALCEFFTPDIDPPRNLFHILYKSASNRSFMACWRNNKRLTPAGFNWTGDQKGPDKYRYLHIITAVTKFPISGGRMEQMIRLKCPYTAEPKWHGRFSDGDTVSWQTINSEFLSRLEPRNKKESDEYWITFGDFRCNFGGLFIISSPEPFLQSGFNMQRSYQSDCNTELNQEENWTEVGYRNRGRRSTAPYAAFPRDFGKRRTNSDSDCHASLFADSMSAPCSPYRADKNSTESTNASVRRRVFLAKGKTHTTRTGSNIQESPSKGVSSRTPQKEHVLFQQQHYASGVEQQQQQQQDAASSDDSSSTSSKNFSSSCLPSPRRRKSTGEKLKDHSHAGDTSPCEFRGVSGATGSHTLKKTPRSNFMKKHSLDTSLHGLVNSPYYSGSIDTTSDFTTSVTESPVWATPVTAEIAGFAPPSPHSPKPNTPEEVKRMTPIQNVQPVTPTKTNTSESSPFSPDVLTSLDLEDSRRPRSAPGTCCVRKEVSLGSMTSLTHSFFLATRADFFRSEGRWKVILEHRDIWSRDAPCADRTRLEIHSKSQRVYFLVTRFEQRDPLLPPTLQEKRHVLISLLQDYRHGPSTANSLLVPIGFCLYKTKHLDRDERRHISKLELVGQVDGPADRREVTARFDLDPGGYFLVPYYHAEQHQGDYLLRVMTESDLGQVKAGCKIS